MKKASLEWILKHKKEKEVVAELEHHHNLKALLDKGYTFHRGDNHMGVFVKGNDFVVYDHSTNKIWFEYTHGHAHRKTRIEYL